MVMRAQRGEKMAIGIMFEAKGVTRQQYEQVAKAVMPNEIMPRGMRYHVAGPVEGGWNVFEIWDSEAEARRFFDEKLGTELKRAGIANVQQRPFPLHALHVDPTFNAQAVSQGSNMKSGVSRV
jgi:hypothetical protein